MLIILLVIFGCANNAYNQKYDVNWVFGDSAGLKFLEDGVTAPFKPQFNPLNHPHLYLILMVIFYFTQMQ